MPCRFSNHIKKTKSNDQLLLIRGVEVLKHHNGVRQWYPMTWGFDYNNLDIHYWVSSYMSGDYHYINKYPGGFEIIRLRFNKVLIYFILKLKLLSLRKIKKRYLKTILPDTVLSRQKSKRSRLGFIMSTSQRGPIRKKIMSYLIG